MNLDDPMEGARAVERGELPSGSAVVRVTGPRSVSHPGDTPESYRQRVRRGELTAGELGLFGGAARLGLDADDEEDLRGALDEARAALRGDSNDAEHDALRSVAETLCRLLGVPTEVLDGDDL